MKNQSMKFIIVDATWKCSSWLHVFFFSWLFRNLQELSPQKPWQGYFFISSFNRCFISPISLPIITWELVDNNISQMIVHRAYFHHHLRNILFNRPQSDAHSFLYVSSQAPKFLYFNIFAIEMTICD